MNYKKEPQIEESDVSKSVTYSEHYGQMFKTVTYNVGRVEIEMNLPVAGRLNEAPVDRKETENLKKLIKSLELQIASRDPNYIRLFDCW